MDSNEINAYNFPDIYQKLEINFDDLGCLMLKVDSSNLPPFINKENLYPMERQSSLADGQPHITLRYGFLKSAWEYRPYIDQILSNWKCETVNVDFIDAFDSVDNPYHTIVARITLTPELLDGHLRLGMLPNIETFPIFKPHLTIAYIKKDEKVKQAVMEYYQVALANKTLNIIGFDYGDKPEEEINKNLTAYCVSCRSSKPLNNPESHQTKNGKNMLSGKCPECNTSIHRFA